MAAIPGIRFDITGASGSQGLLTPKSGWRAYVLNRGGYVSQSSSGTTLTFDSAAIAGRFGVGIWIQAGLSAANIRQVAAVGGNSLTVSGAAVTVSENDRVYIIGSTEPTISGGSVTYGTPSTTIVQRDDDGSDRYTNSMVTSTSDGLIQFFSTPAVYDCLIQDGNQTLQGSLIDVPVGVAEGVSTSQASVFGATVTVNANFGITGWATFGQSATFNANVGITGTLTIGQTLTVHGNAGITGTLVVGATATFSGKAHFGNSVSIDVNLGVTGSISGGTATFGRVTGTSAVFSGDVGFRRLYTTSTQVLGAGNFILSSGWGTTASVTTAGASSNFTRGFIGIMAGGTGITDNPTVIMNWSTGEGVLPSGNFSHFVVSRKDRMAPTTGWWRNVGGIGTTQHQFEFVGLPVVGNEYSFDWIGVG